MRISARVWFITFVAVLFVGSVAALGWVLIQESQQETEQIVTVLETQARDARNQAIRINVLTISCVGTLPLEERTNDALSMCIREGLAEAEGIIEEHDER